MRGSAELLRMSRLFQVLAAAAFFLIVQQYPTEGFWSTACWYTALGLDLLWFMITTGVHVDCLLRPQAMCAQPLANARVRTTFRHHAQPIMVRVRRIAA